MNSLTKSSSSRPSPIQCEGWRRYGGAFTLGPVKWEQCKNEAVIVLTMKQDGEVQEWPACLDCWIEGQKKGIEIISSKPIE